MNLRPIIVIAGPTASGKSDIAIRLAQDINGEIVNADSRQIYSELSIGTAKPSEEEFSSVPHYLFGHVSVKDDYNIYKYQKDVFQVLEHISKDKTPILVGGTGLYIDSIIYNYVLEENNFHKSRKDLSLLNTKQLQSEIPQNILSKLNNSDRNNPRRLIRIIEKGINDIQKKTPFPHKYFVIDIPKDIIEQRVKERIETMFTKGLIEENKVLREQHLENCPALNSIGYSEFNNYFNGNKTIEEIKSEIYKNTLKYIKRQKTWFKRNSESTWTNDYDLILKESKNLLANFLSA